MTDQKLGPLRKDEKARLLQFLRRRQLNERMIGLLDEAKQAHDLKKGEVTTAKNATYEDIVDSITSALSHSWIEKEKVTRVLDNAEVAGRQHVCVFEVPQDDSERVIESLRAPTTLNTTQPEIEEFWNIPLEPYSRILTDTESLLLTKIIAPRKYWVEIDSVYTEDYIEIKRKREKERAAMVVKLSPKERILQLRVPIREQAPGVDTAKSVYSFIAELVASQYGAKGTEWFLRLKPIRIIDAFQKVIENRDDFELHMDTPENKFIKSSMSRKGAAELGSDIRDFDEWVFENGYARNSIRGIWKQPDSSGVDVRMHYEQIKLTKQVTRSIARLYFAKPYTDQDVEHVIKRIREHF